MGAYLLGAVATNVAGRRNDSGWTPFGAESESPTERVSSQEMEPLDLPETLLWAFVPDLGAATDLLIASEGGGTEIEPSIRDWNVGVAITVQYSAFAPDGRVTMHGSTGIATLEFRPATGDVALEAKDGAGMVTAAFLKLNDGKVTENAIKDKRNRQHHHVIFWQVGCRESVERIGNNCRAARREHWSLA